MSFLSLSSEIGWNLAPFLRLPFYNRYVDGVGAEPVLGSGDDLIELFGLGSALQFGLALFLAYPELGIHAVAINYLVGNAFCCIRARAWTMARNSPMLLVPWIGP